MMFHQCGAIVAAITLVTTVAMRTAVGADIVTCWQPQQFILTAENPHPWWEFPVQVHFVCDSNPGASMTIEGVWDGDDRWLVRTAFTHQGRWHWTSQSDDTGLDGESGIIDVVEPSEAQRLANPNFRGQLQIAESGVQSSKPFHDQPWLDHHWLQTGQSPNQMYNIVSRVAENRQLIPAKPVFCSEACYERSDDAESAYHTRWQAWTAMINGAAGFGYGVYGVWQFLDPDDPQHETGKVIRGSLPWREAIERPGSSEVGHVSTLHFHTGLVDDTAK